MDIRLLRYFLAVAREENITRAAESLHISQPSLSKQMMELEQELGKNLLIRGKRKVALTESGVMLRKRAKEIVMLLEKTASEISADTTKIRGEVSIGGNSTMTILQVASALRRDYPEVRFQLYSSDATEVMERLEHGSLDFAVCLEPIDTMKYEYVSLPDSSRWGLFMPAACTLAKKNVVQKADLSAVPLIFHRRAGLQRLVSRWAEVDLEELNIVATYNVIHGSPANLVRSGLGYCLITEDLLPIPLESDVCFRPLEPLLEIHYALVWKRYAIFSRAAEVFLENIKKHCFSEPHR